MNAHIENLTVLNDASGNPAFVILPYDDYVVLAKSNRNKITVPAAVVNLVFDHDWTPVRAWREHLRLSQVDVADKLGISQAAYSKQENSANLRVSSKTKIAQALGIDVEQLNF
ncbi:helix-turn-helix domain-containing protein [Acinetobacter sp. WZC-1]|uniref:helix-turn-helix domain-containing protein n=1 Tax=Acinetobacter sp. WZC-1 TaxID=3459034 RepID=UPI00403D903F